MGFMRLLIIAALAITSISTHAQLRNDIPSCYESNGIERQGEAPERELFVMVDGTFDPDVNLKRSVHRKVHNFLRPGDRVSVVAFSAYGGDRYTSLRFSGLIEWELVQDARDSIGKKVLRKFDHCMSRQAQFVKSKIDAAIKESFKRPDQEVPNSEIIGNFKQVLEPLVQSSPSTGRVVLLVSDMLENSDITSFYRSNNVRKIEPSAELEKVSELGLISDLGKAEIYVIGAGWVPEKYRGKLRGSQVMLSLEQFWREYFLASNARLVGFGKPVLVQELALKSVK